MKVIKVKSAEDSAENNTEEELRNVPKGLSKIFENSVHKMSEKSSDESLLESSYSSYTSKIMHIGLAKVFKRSVYCQENYWMNRHLDRHICHT